MHVKVDPVSAKKCCKICILQGLRCLWVAQECDHYKERRKSTNDKPEKR